MENEKPKIKSIETYTDDMVKILEHDNTGIIKKIIHEEEEREKQKKNKSPESLKNRIFLYGGSLFVFLAVVGIFLVLFLKEKISIIPVKPQFSSVIFTDKNSFFPVEGMFGKENIGEFISREVLNTEVKLGEVEGIHLTENGEPISFRNFITKIQSNFPEEAFSLVEDNFLLGVAHTDTDTKNLFILLKVRSFAEIFPYFRIWEEKMFLDLHGFFGIELTAKNSYLQGKVFEDGIVLNKNARILYDREKKIVLLYVFVNNTSILITDSIQSANEGMLRLSQGKIKK